MIAWVALAYLVACGAYGAAWAVRHSPEDVAFHAFSCAAQGAAAAVAAFGLLSLVML